MVGTCQKDDVPFTAKIPLSGHSGWKLVIWVHASKVWVKMVGPGGGEYPPGGAHSLGMKSCIDAAQAFLNGAAEIGFGKLPKRPRR